MKLFKRSTPTACPSCRAAIEADQISCVECGSMLAHRRSLADAAWKAPVTVIAAVALLMATGIGYASGAVIQDGDVSVAEAPAPQPPLGGGALDSDAGGDVDGGGSDDLAKLDPPGDGGGDGSDFDGGGDGGDGDGNGNGNDGDGDGNGGSSGGGGGSSGGGSGDRGNGGGAPRTEPELRGPEERRDLAELPAGARGFTVALKVTSSRAVALREARAAANEAEGIPAGVISRSDFPGLPGAYVAFAGGPFDSRAKAERARDNYLTLGFPGEVISLGGS